MGIGGGDVPFGMAGNGVEDLDYGAVCSAIIKEGHQLCCHRWSACDVEMALGMDAFVAAEIVLHVNDEDGGVLGGEDIYNVIYGTIGNSHGTSATGFFIHCSLRGIKDY